MTKHVLVVDDEKDIRELLVLTLSRMGIEADTAANCQEAFTRIGERNYDLCLTDMRLPDGDGMQIVDYIAKNSGNTPVAVITAYGSTDNAVAALKAGAFDYLAKPIQLKQLRDLISSALSLPRTSSAAPAESTPRRATTVNKPAPVVALGPQLIGGLAFTNAHGCTALPSFPGLCAVVVHPDFVLETKVARAALAEPFPISAFVQQSDYLASFLLAHFTQDLNLLRYALKDILVEPKRAPLIPGFAEVKAAALQLGAIGASISGAGPSVFAWFEDQSSAKLAAVAMQAAFAAAGLSSNAFLAPVAGRGARVLADE